MTSWRERLAGHAVEERNLARFRQAGDFEQVADLGFARAVKYRRGHGDAVAEASASSSSFSSSSAESERQMAVSPKTSRNQRRAASARVPAVNKRARAAAEFLGRPAEMGLENLADVHTRRNAERIEHDLHGSAVGQIGHVFFGHDAGDDALVAVAAGHLVADGELALHGDVDLHQFDDAGRQFVALLELFLALVGDLAQHVDLPRGHLLDFVDLLDEQRVLVGQAQALQVARGDLSR